MAYTTIDNPFKHFNTKLTTGTGSSQAVTGVGFQPDWIWGKRRDSTGHNSLFDSVRGITKGLESNQTNAEFTSTDYYSSFDSDGFTIAAGSGGAGNGSSQTAVQWCWKAGGAASSNSNGSITSSVSVNTTAGFSIISYTGTGSVATVGHGLGSIPDMVTVKNLSTGSTEWRSMFPNAKGAEYNLNFSSQNPWNDGTEFNDTMPTSSVFTIGTAGDVNTSGNSYIAYCFKNIQGYSKIGTYTGNGSTDGTFIYTGFKPAYVWMKSTSHSVNWKVHDNKRDAFNNGLGASLSPNENSAEDDNTAYDIDFLSNGFKQKNNNANMNKNTYAYIYQAFAENPFVTAGTKAAGTAR